MIHLFLWLSVCLWMPNTTTDTIILDIDNVAAAQGYIWIGIYDSQDNFLVKDKSISLKGVEINETGTIDIPVEDVPFGKIAIAIFHDVNGDGKLNQNLIGIPKEPYAFSQKPRSKWRAPTFEEVQVDFRKPGQGVKMTLETWRL